MPNADTRAAEDTLRQHIAKMETIHGDEPIRVKIALPWAKELLQARATIASLRERGTADAKVLTELREKLENVTAERDAVRVAFAEAWHNAGPAFVAHETLAAAQKERDKLKTELAEAWREAFCCDDIKLDQPLAGVISEMQRDRERLAIDRDSLEVAREALKLVLLFHSGSPWDEDKKIAWANGMTAVLGPAIERDEKVVGSNGDGTWDGAMPTNEATTKNLCNAARAALAKGAA